MMYTLKKLFKQSIVDDKVCSINNRTETILKDTAIVAKSHADLLRRNGVTLQILTGAGADRHD